MIQTEYPLFTVIIPQKNRAEYLVHTLKTCMIQDYPNFEVIVSDDCSEDNSVDVIKEAMEKDPRIKLFAHDHHLGMRDNFEFALNQVRPGYVMALGGDDGLLVNSIWKMYEILSSSNKELLTWPRVIFHYPQKRNSNSKLLITKNKGNGFRMIKSEDFLNRITNTFYYLVDECPMFYIKGVASTELVERVKSRTSDYSFYYCPTPDGFSGVVLAGEVDEYVYSFEPLSISGSTDASQGKNYMCTEEKSQKEAKEFFQDNANRTMHDELASQQYSPLLTLMTADYLLTARDLPGWPGKIPPLDFEKLIILSFKELEKSPYDNTLLVRELNILKKISEQHNLIDLFNNLMNTTKRRVVKKDVFRGFIFSPHKVMFKGSSIGVNNIFDASVATPYIYKIYNSISFKAFIRVINRILKSLYNRINYQVEHLPKLDN